MDDGGVTLPTSKQFQYIKLESAGRRYFCLQQNLAVLAWILYFKKDTLRPIIRPDSKKLSIRLIASRLRNNYRIFRKKLKILILFARYKYQLRRIDSVVSLSLYGQLCAPVHKGYKIFDLRREVVAKVFDHDVNTSIIVSEIELSKKTSQIDFAPSIRRWNIAERWYEEEYVSGSPDDPQIPPDSRTLLKRFSHDLVQHLNSLILFQQPIIKSAVEYATEIMGILEVTRLSRQDSTVREFIKTKSFLDSILERLRVEGNCPVFLVFAHGDFCPANMLITRHGIKLIDWEGAGYRSALFDFYSYFFYGAVTHKVPISKVVSEVSEAMPLFISSVAKKAPEISNSLLYLEKVYRCIYYVEQVSQEVKREMTDTRPDMIDFILGYIQAFDRYEEILAGNHTVVRRV